MTNRVCSFLIELVLQGVPDDIYAKLFKTHFSGKCKEMALHSSANFIVQQLILFTRTKDQVSLMFYQFHIQCALNLTCQNTL